MGTIDIKTVLNHRILRKKHELNSNLILDRKITFICTFRIIVSNQGLLNIQVWFLNKKVSSLIKLGLPFSREFPTLDQNMSLYRTLSLRYEILSVHRSWQEMSKQDGNLLLKPIANSNRQARDCKQFIICYAVKSRIKTNKIFWSLIFSIVTLWRKTCPNFDASLTSSKPSFGHLRLFNAK